MKNNLKPSRYRFGSIKSCLYGFCFISEVIFLNRILIMITFSCLSARVLSVEDGTAMEHAYEFSNGRNLGALSSESLTTLAPTPGTLKPNAVPLSKRPRKTYDFIGASSSKRLRVEDEARDPGENGDASKRQRVLETREMARDYGRIKDNFELYKKETSRRKKLTRFGKAFDKILANIRLSRQQTLFKLSLPEENDGFRIPGLESDTSRLIKWFSLREVFDNLKICLQEYQIQRPPREWEQKFMKEELILLSLNFLIKYKFTNPKYVAKMVKTFPSFSNTLSSYLIRKSFESYPSPELMSMTSSFWKTIEISPKASRIQDLFNAFELQDRKIIMHHMIVESYIQGKKKDKENGMQDLSSAIGPFRKSFETFLPNSFAEKLDGNPKNEIKTLILDLIKIHQDPPQIAIFGAEGHHPLLLEFLTAHHMLDYCLTYASRNVLRDLDEEMLQATQVHVISINWLLKIAENAHQARLRMSETSYTLKSIEKDLRKFRPTRIEGSTPIPQSSEMINKIFKENHFTMSSSTLDVRNTYYLKLLSQLRTEVLNFDKFIKFSLSQTRSKKFEDWIKNNGYGSIKDFLEEYIRSCEDKYDDLIKKVYKLLGYKGLRDEWLRSFGILSPTHPYWSPDQPESLQFRSFRDFKASIKRIKKIRKNLEKNPTKKKIVWGFLKSI